MWPFRDRTNESSLPTFDVANTIGAGSRVRGDLSGPGGFRIDGAVDGAIESEGPVVVGEGGSVDGGIRGRDVVVLGRVRGDVHATGHLEIGPAGKVLGDINVQSFRMHKGGVFRGVSCMETGEATTAALPAFLAPMDLLDAPRGRTLPPPNGAVPPPPSLAAMAVAVLAPAIPHEAISQQRLISGPSGNSADDESDRRVGT